MSTKPSPLGETERIAVEEATATIAGVPLVKFDTFSIEVEDPSARERTTDGHTVHFDQLINPSGSCAVYPTSPSAGRFFALVQARYIGGARLSFPSDDTRGGISLKGVRYSNVSQEDLSSDGYTITADWEADYIG
ncbi:hypothetical protein [Halocatena halophila]|uniref:hypothetical protein n=1 Tax=Halocatena halophila TaxID=2814576 RepID=UPI002ED1473F